MYTIYIMVGLPGSGKSTWAKEKAKDKKTVIINRDSLRIMTKGKYLYDTKTEPLIKAMAKCCFIEAISSGYDVIIDDTNFTKEQRAQWITLLRGVNIIFVWCKESKRNVDLRMSDARGTTREKWAAVIAGMKRLFQKPSLKEGASEIIEVEIDGTR